MHLSTSHSCSSPLAPSVPPGSRAFHCSSQFQPFPAALPAGKGRSLPCLCRALRVTSGCSRRGQRGKADPGWGRSGVVLPGQGPPAAVLPVPGRAAPAPLRPAPPRPCPRPAPLPPARARTPAAGRLLPGSRIFPSLAASPLPGCPRPFPGGAGPRWRRWARPERCPGPAPLQLPRARPCHP